MAFRLDYRLLFLQLGKVLLLLVEREELLVILPALTQPSREIVPIEDLNRAILTRHLRARFIFSVCPTDANATACFQTPSRQNNAHHDS